MRITEKISNGKLVTLIVSVSNDRVDNIRITGDFFLYPEESITALESNFLGIPVSISDVELSNKISEVLKNSTLIGLTIEDLVRLFKKVVQ